MTRLLVASACAWPLLLGAAVLARRGEQRPPWTAVVYASASRICHQRPDRSFFAGAVQWPVCGRCSGLYLAAPVGALLALPRRRALESRRARWVVGLAAVPTALTLGVEWGGLAPLSNLIRALAAAPLGMAIAWALVRVSATPDR